jgi:hypothetical protein
VDVPAKLATAHAIGEFLLSPNFCGSRHGIVNFAVYDLCSTSYVRC